jgi:CheY-like chemotaxis protein
MKIQILQIDLKEETRKAVEESLAKAEIQDFVITDVQAAEALPFMEVQPVFLVIVEIELPHVEGMAVIKGLKDLPPTHRPSQILIVSDSFDPSIQQKNSAVVSYVSKPLSLPGITEHFKSRLPSKSAEKKGKQKVDLAFIPHFFEGFSRVIEINTSVPVERKRSRLKLTGECLKADVGVSIPLNSTHLNGSMIIAAPELSVMNLGNKMLSTNDPELTADHIDALCEISNQVYGHAKRILNQEGHNFPTAFPVKMDIKPEGIPLSEGCLGVSVNWESVLGLFFLEFHLKIY